MNMYSTCAPTVRVNFEDRSTVHSTQLLRRCALTSVLDKWPTISCDRQLYSHNMYVESTPHSICQWPLETSSFANITNRRVPMARTHYTSHFRSTVSTQHCVKTALCPEHSTQLSKAAPITRVVVTRCQESICYIC